MIEWPIEPQNKKYTLWYERLIKKAKNRDFPKNLYGENHHIIPKSFGGSNNTKNLVRLTAREHYVAHALLWKMAFPNVYHAKMAYAFGTFIYGFKQKEHKKYKFSSRLYESFKKDYAIQLSIYQSGENNPFYGKKHNEETKKIIGSKSKLKTFKRGPENPCWGKKQNLSDKGRKERSNRSKRCWANPEWKKMMLEKRRAFFQTEKGKEQIKAFTNRNRRKRTPEEIEKTASKKRGKKAHEIFSPQALLNIAEGRKHRKYSPEEKKKLAERTRALGKRPKTEEHKKKIAMAHKGKDKPWLKGINNPVYGKPRSPETLQKIRDTKYKNKITKLATKFYGPLKPKTAIKFRGVVYASMSIASIKTNIPIGKIKTQLKHWGDDPGNDIIKQLDSGTLKPPMVAWNKGLKIGTPKNKVKSTKNKVDNNSK